MNLIFYHPLSLQFIEDTYVKYTLKKKGIEFKNYCF